MTAQIEERVEELEKKNEELWEALLQTQWGSREAQRIGDERIAVCRQIRRLKVALEDGQDPGGRKHD